MSLEQRKTIFGIHQITAYDLDTRLPLGTAKVVGSASLNFSGELIELTGGSSAYPWSAETGPITTEMSITVREFPNWFFPAFLGQAVSENAAEPSASISSALANVNGSSVLSVTTGIASVSVKTGNEIDVKTGVYVVKAVSATTVDVYAMTDVDFGTGAKKQYVDESLKINETPLTVTSGDATEINGFGVELNGGSGTISLIEGDTAAFEVRAINFGSDEVVIGQSTDKYKAIGLLLIAQRSGSNETVMIDVFRAQGLGVPFSLTEKEFSEAEVPMKAFRDEARDGVFKFVRNRGVN